MTRRLLITPRARADLIDIATHIAQHNPVAAERVVSLMREKSELIAEFPGMGRPDTQRPGRRLHVVGNYLIQYREAPESITVLRYYHTRRDPTGM